MKEIQIAKQKINVEWKKKRSLHMSLYADQEQAFIEANPKLDPKKVAKILQTAKINNRNDVKITKKIQEWCDEFSCSTSPQRRH